MYEVRKNLDDYWTGGEVEKWETVKEGFETRAEAEEWIEENGDQETMYIEETYYTM